ncbi:MAG: inner membrane-spanning protein YciB [Pseudomonadota bacterium]
MSDTQRLTGRAKALADYGPLAVFFVAYFLGDRITRFIGARTGNEWCLTDGAEMYLAVGAFMPAFAIAFAYSTWKERRVAPMLLVSGVLIGVLGSLTLILRDKTFFYMKPTIVYVLFAAALFGGLAAKRNVLKLLFDDALRLPDDAWRTLTTRYAAFFVALAVINEVAWRWLTRDCAPVVDAATGFFGACEAAAGAPCPGEATWVNLKIFGFTLLNIVFIAAQMPLLMKHQEDDGSTA